MPIMGGRELAKRLTKLRPDLKIIFTSGYTTEVIDSESRGIDVLAEAVYAGPARPNGPGRP